MQDKDILIEEALLVLVAIDLPLSRLLWLHCVEEKTEEELATDFKVSEKAIRRQLNGYTRHDGKYIWGAKDYLKLVYRILQEAERHECLGGVEMAFRFACKTNPWSTPFPGVLLEIFLQAIESGVLVHFMKHLAIAQKQADTYTQLLLQLLELYRQNRLTDFFKELPATYNVQDGGQS